MRDRVRGPLPALVAIAALALIALPSAAAAKPKPKPRLALKELIFHPSTAQSSSAAYPSAVIESDGKGRFGLEFKVKNTGRARSHNVHVDIFFSGKKYTSELVGPIDPGKARTVDETYHPRFAGPGLHDTHACLGAKNCTKHVRFVAVPRRWNVDLFSTGPNTLAGGAPFFAAKAEGMVFDYYGPIIDNGDPYFLWLATGGVTGDITGDDGFCTYSGHGAVSHSPWDVVMPETGYLEISPQLDSYFAEIKEENHAFLGTQTCPGYPDNTQEYSILPLETIGLDGRVDRTMESNAKMLSGGYTIPTDIGSGYTIGAWQFKANVP